MASIRNEPASAEQGIEQWLNAFLREPTFLLKYPFYAAILGKMQPVSDPSVERMAVSLIEGRFYLHINVDSFIREPHYLLGVLLHEVHHVALGHLGHPKFAEADDAELMDLALEMSANEYIEEPLPFPIVWQPYAALGMRAGQSTLERYEKLRNAKRGGERVPSVHGKEKSDEKSRVDDHRFLREKTKTRDDGSSEHTRKLLKDAIDQVASQQAQQTRDDLPNLLAGKSPGRLLEELVGVYGAAQTRVDWKNALRMFVARARGPVHTWSRPNRRFPHLIGVIPGRTYAPRTIVRPSLLVVIDTSLSMATAELEEVARQLNEIAEMTRVTIVECDAELTRTYPFTGAIVDVAGRGGTDLRPPFEREFLGKHRADGLVYFTDGDGPYPELAPPLPVLWVLTKANDFACPWGERVCWMRAAPKRSRR